jgi:protein-tyrosine phosphatase
VTTCDGSDTAPCSARELEYPERVSIDRDLDWDGCFNVRDLGGLRTSDGRVTRWGAIVRADSLDRLTPVGWSALKAYGIRTILDLRNHDECTTSADERQADVNVKHVPLDDLADASFWGYWASGPQFGTPLYYRPFLERKPERCAAAVAAVARADPGGVVINCGGGRDRTGLVTLLLLGLVGAQPDEIASDYELSYERMRLLYAELGEEDQGPMIQEYLRGEKTSARTIILDILSTVDVMSCLLAAGLTHDDVSAVRNRLLGIAAQPHSSAVTSR